MKIEELDKPLDATAVKSRSKGSFDLSYIEGWWAISEANRIFGFDGWDRETVYNKEVSRHQYKKNNDDMYKVGYEAKVRISVVGKDSCTDRDGTGHGSGIAKDLFDAIEGAAKEAETDAMKRALMTFGNPFGLALYDKTQANVARKGDHRFKSGEKEEIIKRVLDSLHNGDEHGLKEILEQYDDNEIKMKVWGLFNSSERSAIKALLNEDK